MLWWYLPQKKISVFTPRQCIHLYLRNNVDYNKIAMYVCGIENVY